MDVRQKMKEVPHSMMNTGTVFSTIQHSSRVPTLENAPITEVQGTRSPIPVTSPRAVTSPRMANTYTPPMSGRRIQSPLVD